MRRYALAVSAVLVLTLLVQPVLATCGGGGGGGMGGVAPGGEAPQVYRVGWKVVPPGSAVPKGPEVSLLALWFPTSADAARASGMQTSRALSLAGARCVAEALVTPDNQAVQQALKAPAGAEAFILAAADGSEIGRVQAEPGGKLDVRAVETLVDQTIGQREENLEQLFKSAEKRAKAGDASAADDLRKVWDDRCLFPGLGKKAAKALKKLGVAVDSEALLHLGPDGLADPDVHGAHGDVERVLTAGLAAELGGKYADAEKLYRQATELDPADPTALRFLAELYRHQTGQWDLSKVWFEKVLAQPADPVARAVALHGLGKMTIHAGKFKAGLAMFERSLAEFPLPITYRNLAVYWFSEKQTEKATGYMRQALALEPNDGYNQIFAAVYLAVAGHRDEAMQVARENEAVLEASYNLAAIYAQAGDRRKAMELLRRHFYEYERYDAVRAMEMQEARDDYMFADLHGDPAFVELTHLAARHKM